VASQEPMIPTPFLPALASLRNFCFSWSPLRTCNSHTRPLPHSPLIPVQHNVTSFPHLH
jgi:hypothetical protein